jgi:hypothetical protein
MKATTPIPALLLAAALGPATAVAQQSANPPDIASALRQAYAAAGGMTAFRELGIIRVDMAREEVTQEGKIEKSELVMFVKSPGPAPGRLENPGLKVVAGDDGSRGWALVGGQMDSRPSTVVMVRRMIRSDLFAPLLPFSLAWEGVAVTGVTAADVAGTPTWRLAVEMERSFFHTPQISTTWTVDLDRRTFKVLRAMSPFTDLGKGITADGMLFTWSEPVRLGGVTLNGLQKVVGLDVTGREKSHSRVDRHRFTPVSADREATLFTNPVPPDQRPTVPAFQPPKQPTT